ncbi:MAG: inner membrane CreD family protein [Thermoanaerobaculia bacterium]|jgi:inner membrane protein involved in colicin E2 resistance
MTKTILALIAIFLCTSIAWGILGTTILARTHSTDSSLESRVASNWGCPQQQSPPSATTPRVVVKTVEETVNNQTVKRAVEEIVNDPLSLERSRLRVGLDLEQRQKGLLWFATYRVAFAGDYRFRNDTASDQVRLTLAFPSADAIYDDLVFRVDGKPVATTTANGAVSASVVVPRGETVRLETGYRSQGMNTWHYSFGEGVTQVHDLQLDMQTDFAAIDFPQGSVSPTTKTRAGAGWLLSWKFSNLVTGYRIGMVMPERIQPGPLAGRISYFAPVSLLFFFFLMFIITTMRGIRLHPMHYFFLATSFFAFHLLLAYLVDHISVHAAFAIASAVSIFLVISYLRVVTGTRFAFVEAGLAQLVYLVGFSYAFFFEGFTGLAITIGAIVSLFVVMQMTARIEWGREARRDAVEAAR